MGRAALHILTLLKLPVDVLLTVALSHHKNRSEYFDTARQKAAIFRSVGQLLLFGPIRNILSLLDRLFLEEQIEEFFLSTIGQIYIDKIAFIFRYYTLSSILGKNVGFPFFRFISEYFFLFSDFFKI